MSPEAEHKEERVPLRDGATTFDGQIGQVQYDCGQHIVHVPPVKHNGAFEPIMNGPCRIDGHENFPNFSSTLQTMNSKLSLHKPMDI